MLAAFRRPVEKAPRLKKLADFLLGASSLQYLPVRARGGLIRGARWTLYPFTSYWRGTSDLEAVRWIDRFVRPGGVAWDLGAHFGLYTVGMATRVGATGQVVSLEPEPAAFARCRRHVGMNRLDWVRIFPLAASSTNGAVGLVSAEGAGSTTSYVTRDPGAGPLLTSVRLDDLMARENLRPPDFVKVDVENHGAEALEGARGVLASARPNLLMSFHSEDELAGTQAILAPLGYRVLLLDGSPADWPAALYKTVLLLPPGDFAAASAPSNLP
jgi:FkbM family methyltransferase